MRGVLIFSFLMLVACQSDPGVPSPPVEAPRHDFKWIGYDPTTASLSVQFNDGSRSNYAGVSPTVYQDFMRSMEKRSFFTNTIQGKYEGRAEP